MKIVLPIFKIFLVNKKRMIYGSLLLLLNLLVLTKFTLSQNCCSLQIDNNTVEFSTSSIEIQQSEKGTMESESDRFRILSLNSERDNVESILKDSETNEFLFAQEHPEYNMFISDFGGKELLHERDRFSKTFLNPDGTFSKQKGYIPLHYSKDGLWFTKKTKP